MTDEEVKSPYELQAMEVWCPRCNAEFVTYYNSCEASLFAQLAARDKRIAELEAAIESYRTGVEWGKVYAWLQHGAPTEVEGIAMAKRIIHLHVNADALAGGASCGCTYDTDGSRASICAKHGDA